MCAMLTQIDAHPNPLRSSAMDQTKKKVTLLSPLPGRLPRKTLLLASLDWQDS